MNITITCRHEFKTDDVKNYAMEKMKKLGKYYNNITKIEVVMNSVKEKHSAEAVISVSRGTRLVGRALHEDARAAIDLMVGKMERQLVRFKERLKDRRGSRIGEEAVPEGSETVEESEEIEKTEVDDEDL